MMLKPLRDMTKNQSLVTEYYGIQEGIDTSTKKCIILGTGYSYGMTHSGYPCWEVLNFPYQIPSARFSSPVDVINFIRGCSNYGPGWIMAMDPNFTIIKLVTRTMIDREWSTVNMEE